MTAGGVLSTASNLPVAADDFVAMVVNNEQYIDVLINDTDEDSGDVLVITSATTDVGTVSIIDNQLYYVSTNNYDGGDITINYDVNDNNGGTDPEGDVLRLVTVDNTNVSFNYDGQAMYTPAANFYGDVVISYTVQDSFGNTAVGQWVIEVIEVQSTTTKGCGHYSGHCYY